ncbi:PAS domain S-box protein [Sphingomonas sp. KR1UV-12]|uniref:histidine kinase n=1 Tax=Sphingomonas aurea TaxID=3063994 RepID=A0ABT9EJ56_9SPHN|nr:PAS domain S-box protein [Sphingomonas sp. KR1UV-12]MDP1026887.1 PAS domain S-box protein [Sphingomonas sp. KR1UV-12]
MANDDRLAEDPMIAEADRLAALQRHDILDTSADGRFDRIVALVRNVCRVPVALVSLVDADRQWFKARNGVEIDQPPLDTSVCALAIRQRDLFQIEDLAADPRTFGMSLVTGEPHLRFYAGAPLITRDGLALGSLCAIDTKPRAGGLDGDQADALVLLAQQVVELIENSDAIESRTHAMALDQAERRAREDEDRYHAIVNSAIDNAIIAMDADGIVTSWSSGAERIFGWSEADMCGSRADRFFTPEDREAGIPDREFAIARRDGRASDERWHLRKDGSRFFAHGAMTPLKGSGRPGYVKAVRDITAEHETKAALEDARRSAELMTAAARLGTFDYDLVRDTLSWDDGCRALFGLPPGAPVTYQEAFLLGVHPDDRAGADTAVATALDPSGTGRFETDYRTVGIEDGVLRHVAARGQTLFEHGRAVRLLGTVQDVTEARIAETRLRETEQRLRFANRATNDAIWDWDLVRDHVTWNEAIEQAHGHRLDRVEPTGAWWIEHIHPEDRARIDASIHAVIDSGATDWSDNYRFLRADGSYADIRDRGYVIRDEAGHPLRMVGAMLDLTEQMRVERELRRRATDLAERVEASAAEVERLWNASPDLLVLADPNGIYRRVSPAWTTMLGYSPEEVVGRDHTAFVHPDDLPATRQALGIAQVGELPAYLCRFRHKDGTYRWLSWAAAPSEGDIFAIGRDVTATREAEEVLRQTEDALRQSQKVEAVGQLTGGVAHDFNNLLTVIRGSVDLLRRPGLSDEKRIRYVDAIADTADRATKLTSQLLAFARRQTLQPQVFDAAVNVGSLADMLQTLTGSRIEARYELEDKSTPVMADPSQFDTAIVNMAVNARDAMNGEGQLTIAVSIVPELPALRSHAALWAPHVAISISDTGMGIPADQLDRVFEPFFTTKEVGHGTGLGLSQVFGFAKQSSGDVAVESVVGRGTTFILYLPLAAGADAQAEASRPVVQPLEADACILVVEDNKDVGEFATRALTELGHGSYWVQDAEAALAELKRSPGRYDIVFTDVVMPGRSGIDLAADIADRYPDLPVVLTSGYSHVLAQEGTRGLTLLRKPYSLDELAQVLARAIS